MHNNILMFTFSGDELKGNDGCSLSLVSRYYQFSVKQIQSNSDLQECFCQKFCWHVQVGNETIYLIFLVNNIKYIKKKKKENKASH